MKATGAAGRNNMIAYNKITKRELYRLHLLREVLDLEREITPDYTQTTATMFHAWCGGWISENDAHLVSKKGNPHVPDFANLVENYGTSSKESELAGYRKKLEGLNKDLLNARDEYEKFVVFKKDK